ncbi:MAG TPA: hypothetical protein PKJ14_04070 [Candidatus Cloacimonadota bacterium]|nr:hypothetical protein [Candidatus Cloacimonadota bacterium]HQL15644.1 hypothetical protein [Candidatus Cloacimonadota bacterium]
MRRFFLICLALFAVCLSATQTSVTKITASTDNPLVSRITITLSEKTAWSHTVDRSKHQLIITLQNCELAAPSPSGIDNNNLISSVTFAGSPSYLKIIVTVNGPFLLETSSAENPFRIFLDIFAYHDPYTYEDYLAQTRFYEQTEQWDAAAKEYAIMMRHYPKQTDGYYLWALTLLRSNKPEEAKTKLRLVSTDSKYYPAAQAALIKLENNEPAEAILNEAQRFTTHPLSQASEKSNPDTVLTQSAACGSGTLPSSDKKRYSILFSLPLWFWLLVLIILAVLFLIIIDIALKGKERKNTAATLSKIGIVYDAGKQDLVVRLLERGWQENEIARELLLTEPEADFYIRRGKKIIKRKKHRRE